MTCELKQYYGGSGTSSKLSTLISRNWANPTTHNSDAATDVITKYYDLPIDKVPHHLEYSVKATHGDGWDYASLSIKVYFKDGTKTDVFTLKNTENTAKASTVVLSADKLAGHMIGDIWRVEATSTIWGQGRTDGGQVSCILYGNNGWTDI